MIQVHQFKGFVSIGKLSSNFLLKKKLYYVKKIVEC